MAYYATLFAWAVPTINMSLLSRNVAGQSKKTVAVALNFIIWAAGTAIGEVAAEVLEPQQCANGVIGPQVFLARDSPRYFIAFSTHIGCYALLIVILVTTRIYLRHQNKKRDELALSGISAATPGATDHAWDDLTDKENLSFRYVF
jgi:hypothetical protein